MASKGFIQRVFKRFGYVPQTARRNIFAGVSTDRLYSSWTTTNYSADNELYNSLKTLRARSRELERNNDYAKKFLRMVRSNIVGQNGIRLQSQVMSDNGKAADEIARLKIEDAWARWCAKGICDVTGGYSFRDIQKLAASTIARDGEIFIRLVRGFDNPFKFALQLLEADHVDEQYSDLLSNGNRIKMGIEYDEWGRPVKYHVYRQHPGDFFPLTAGYGERIAIPAGEIIHLFVPVRPSQTRGLPWMHAAMTRMNMLGGLQEAELVASRISAAKGGFYTSQRGEEYTGDDSENGSPIQEVEPGIFETLPQGWGFQPFDPQHPTTAFPAFVKSLLQGISSGLDVSYNYLANDLEGVNYSSIRAGVIDERDVWRDLQSYIIEHFLIPVFNTWLEMSLLSGAVNLPFAKIEKFKRVKFQPRGWQWVDPEKDMQAKILAMNSGLDTGADIAAEQGKDLEEIYEQLAREKELRERYNLKLNELENQDGTAPQGSAGPGSEEAANRAAVPAG